MNFEIWAASGITFIICVGAAALYIRIFYTRLLDRRIEAFQSGLIERHVQEVQNMYRQMRGWRHDYKNHIQTMQAYLEMQELGKLKSYLAELNEDLNTVDRVVKTGNIMLDAMLNSKLSLAKSQNIRVEATAKVPEKLKVSEVDLSIVLGNLMDNAMEACLKLENAEDGFIRVYIDTVRGSLYIYVINSVNETLKRRAGTYMSTKRGREHGFGLMRIDRVVEKYHGFLERQHEEGVFATEILLPI